jgi:hypothetical protein
MQDHGVKCHVLFKIVYIDFENIKTNNHKLKDGKQRSGYSWVNMWQ